MRFAQPSRLSKLKSRSTSRDVSALRVVSASSIDTRNLFRKETRKENALDRREGARRSEEEEGQQDKTRVSASVYANWGQKGHSARRERERLSSKETKAIDGVKPDDRNRRKQSSLRIFSPLLLTPWLRQTFNRDLSLRTAKFFVSVHFSESIFKQSKH